MHSNNDGLHYNHSDVFVREFVDEPCWVAKKPDRFDDADELEKVEDVVYSEPPEKFPIFVVNRFQAKFTIFVIFHI